MAEYSYDGIMDYIMQVSISDESFVANDILSSFHNEVRLTAKNGKYSSILHLLASCNAIQKPLNSIYPKAENPGVDRDIHNPVFFPTGKIYYPDTLNGMLTILWTHTCDIDMTCFLLLCITYGTEVMLQIRYRYLYTILICLLLH